MARIRTIKPDFFLDSKLAKKHPLVRIFFQGLWCLADREGRLEEDLDKLKVQIIPYDKMSAEKCLLDLHPDFILRYEIGQKQYIQVKNFTKHQHPHPKEPKSEYPGPLSSEAVERNGEPRKETASKETNSKVKEGNMPLPASSFNGTKNNATRNLPDALKADSEIIEKWLAYLAERNRAITGPIALDALFKNLLEIGPGRAAAIEHSMAKGWLSIQVNKDAKKDEVPAYWKPLGATK